MSEFTSEEQVAQLLATSITETSQSSTLRTLHLVLTQARASLGKPMRVAIVGLIKAGKSTVMNALLGETVVPTGAVEATFNVNWLHYAPKPVLLTHFKDGPPCSSRTTD